MKRILSLLLTLAMVLSMTGIFGITVSAADPSVKFSYQTVTVPKGRAVTLKPKVSGVSDYTLVWSTSDKSIASVNSSGKVSGIKDGSAVITVKIKGTDASAKVKVSVGKRVTSVSVEDTSITLKKGGKYQLDWTVSPSDAANKKLKISTSNKRVATINNKGVITAVANGTAKITVKATDGSGKKAVITVKVGSKASSSDSKKKDTASTNTSSGAQTTGGFDKSISSMKIASDMKIGWNLGNSLDAINGSGMGTETSWGNPKTTQSMIDDIKKAGFNTVRIPVSWHKHIDSNGNIDKSWMSRVKEVVDYAYNNDMYVILNSHHDNSIYNIGKCVDNADEYKKSETTMTTIWTQIANNFKKYDHHLIFETMNEPRTEGSAQEWSGGTAKEREIVYDLNDAIVAAIRKTGGNNAYRSIMVPSYAATSSTGILSSMRVPEDEHIIVSVHAYSPYNFAMNGNYSKGFSQNDKNELTKFFSELDRIFISKGIPVVIGEFGATNKDNISDRCAWAEFYVKGAKKYGIPCVVWDNNSGLSSGGECFGLYNRDTGEWLFPELVETYVNSAK